MLDPAFQKVAPNLKSSQLTRFLESESQLFRTAVRVNIFEHFAKRMHKYAGAVLRLVGDVPSPGVRQPRDDTWKKYNKRVKLIAGDICNGPKLEKSSFVYDSTERDVEKYVLPTRQKLIFPALGVEPSVRNWHQRRPLKYDLKKTPERFVLALEEMAHVCQVTSIIPDQQRSPHPRLSTPQPATLASQNRSPHPRDSYRALYPTHPIIPSPPYPTPPDPTHPPVPNPPTHPPLLHTTACLAVQAVRPLPVANQ